MMKTFLITGGAGFLGSQLCGRLINAGNAVICLDDCSSGSEKNISHLTGREGFRFVKGDITKPLEAFELDAIFNLACPASPADYQRDPIKTMRTNIIGSINLLDLATKCRIPILQASTSEIYGDPMVHPQTESYYGHVNPIGIRACYDEGKRCAEALFFDYWRQYGTRIKVARIFNTYGPGMRAHDGRVVSNFITQAIKGEDITLYGSGNQTRSFCFVDDLVEGLIRLMSAPDSFHGPVNLGNPHEFTVKELAELILEMTASKSRLVFRPLPLDDPKRRKPDITLAKQALVWEPTVDLRSGLKITVDYFRNLLED
jgi:UDP-glucuronate decarboxylase